MLLFVVLFMRKMREKEREIDRWNDLKKGIQNVGRRQEVHKHSELY